VELFDQLLALKGSPVTPAVSEALSRAREAAWTWVVKYPLKNGNWCAMCEDITVRANAWETYGAGGQASNGTCSYDNYRPGQECITTCNYDSIQPLMFAKYMLQNKVPGWEADVPALIGFVERRYKIATPQSAFSHHYRIPISRSHHCCVTPAVQFGARTVSEQRADHARMSCHTTR
jgi:hypothetical protein